MVSTRGDGERLCRSFESAIEFAGAAVELWTAPKTSRMPRITLNQARYASSFRAEYKVCMIARAQ